MEAMSLKGTMGLIPGQVDVDVTSHVTLARVPEDYDNHFAG
jgi:hypothetical protein